MSVTNNEENTYSRHSEQQAAQMTVEKWKQRVSRLEKYKHNVRASFVCICICMYVCTCVHTRIIMYVCMHSCICSTVQIVECVGGIDFLENTIIQPTTQAEAQDALIAAKVAELDALDAHMKAMPSYEWKGHEPTGANSQSPLLI